MASEKKADEVVNCMLCAEPLVYTADATKQVQCVYCHKQAQTNVTCAAGHFVCDQCHSRGPNDLIEESCLHTPSTDPLEIATLLMKSPSFHQNGPEHHFLVPAVMIAAYCNTVQNVTPEKRAEMLKTARQRAEKVPGGFCGFNGACGGCIGAGIATSVITGATPLSKKEWGLSNRVTGELLISLGELGGPRCCKRSVFNAIVLACAFFEKNLGVKIGPNGGQIPKPVCTFDMKNAECLGRRCPFSKKATPEAITHVKEHYMELCGHELF